MKRIAMFGLLLLLAALTAACGMVTTGEEAGAKAGEIAEFDVPEGFTADFGMDVGGMLMIGYNRANTNSHFFLIQAPESAGVTTAQLEQSLRDAIASGESSSAIETTDTEEIPVTIRGEEVTATVGTGTGGNGSRSVRVITVPFTGNGGPALLLYQTDEAEWDQAEVDAFLASFR